MSEMILNEPVHGYIVYKIRPIEKVAISSFRNYLVGSEIAEEDSVYYFLNKYKDNGNFDINQFEGLLDLSEKYRIIEVFYSLKHLSFLKENLTDAEYIFIKSFDIVNDYSLHLNVKLPELTENFHFIKEENISNLST